MPQIFAHEGIHHLHQQYSGCAYQAIGLGCKFCGAGKTFIQNTPQEIAETVLAAFEDDHNYQACLGGGTKLTPGKGSEYFLECIKLIREKNKIIPI
jgi:hypothetical protein